MTTWMKFETVRRQVAIAGQVKDAVTQQVIAGALVKFIAMPEALETKVTFLTQLYGDDLKQRPDQTQTATDGTFHFVDLPSGTYTVEASLPAAGTRYNKIEAEVTVNAPNANSDSSTDTVQIIALNLPPTALSGSVKDSSNHPIAMAKIQVKGLGEYTFSNKDGEYQLIGLEISGTNHQYQLKVTAPTFPTAHTEAAVTLSRGQTTIRHISLAAAANEETNSPSPPEANSPPPEANSSEHGD